MRGGLAMAEQGTSNLDALVAQHFQRLDVILDQTIRQLEELRRCIPDAVLKNQRVKWSPDGRSFAMMTQHYSEESPDGALGPMTDHVGFTVPMVHDRAPALPPPVELNWNGDNICCTVEAPCGRHTPLSGLGEPVHIGHNEGEPCTAECHTPFKLVRRRGGTPLF